MPPEAAGAKPAEKDDPVTEEANAGAKEDEKEQAGLTRDGDPAPEGDDLGPEGTKAIAAMKKRERESRAKLRKAEEKLAALEEQSKTEQEKALDKARKEAAEAAKGEVAAEYRKRILNAEIRTAAAGKLADPSDAVALLDLDAEDAFDDEGEVKAAEIKAAIDALIERKPHLKADPSNGRPTGDDDAGKGSGGSKRPEDMTPEDWEQEMYGSKK